MASIETRNGSHRIKFRFEGSQRSLNLGEITADEAASKLGQIEYLLTRLANGTLVLPARSSIEDFLRHDGRPPSRDGASEDLTLVQFRDRYLAAAGASLVPKTIQGIEGHFRRLAEKMGLGFRIRSLTLGDLQKYVSARAADSHHGKPITTATIKAELISLRTAWNWARKHKVVDGEFPSDGLRFPRAVQKPPFATRGELERRRSGLVGRARDDVWEALYLQADELAEVLDAIKAKAVQPWVHPMAATAAYTGARRSELARLKIADVDLEGGTILIHERKRVRGTDSTRRVPIVSELTPILRSWLARHPGGPLLFRHETFVDRSKKRSRTTGHKGQPTRSTKLKGRLAGVSPRQAPGVEPITSDECHDHLRRALTKSPWSVVRGWHVFRHSFISACATAGVDERMLREWAGHMTAAMQRRYAHLYPSRQREVIQAVFGSKPGRAEARPAGSGSSRRARSTKRRADRRAGRQAVFSREVGPGGTIPSR